MNGKFRRGLIIASLLLVTACATLVPDFDDPEVELIGLEPLRSTLTEARFKVTLRVINSNSIALDLDGVYYEIFVEGERLLSGVSSDAVKLPAYSSAILDLETTASVLGSFNLIQKLLGSPPENGIGYQLRAKLSLAKWPNAIRVQREGRIGQRPQT